MKRNTLPPQPVKIINSDPIGRRVADLVHLKHEGSTTALCYVRPRGDSSKFVAVTNETVNCKKCMNKAGLK